MIEMTINSSMSVIPVGLARGAGPLAAFGTGRRLRHRRRPNPNRKFTLRCRRVVEHEVDGHADIGCWIADMVLPDASSEPQL
jgi:hypothetical protein